MSQATYALFATLFAIVFIIAVLVLGGEYARYAATAAAFLGCASQFIGQDDSAWKWSRRLAYAGFASGVAALGLYAAGM